MNIAVNYLEFLIYSVRLELMVVYIIKYIIVKIVIEIIKVKVVVIKTN
jgi:hypothetical protein